MAIPLEDDFCLDCGQDTIPVKIDGTIRSHANQQPVAGIILEHKWITFGDSSTTVVHLATSDSTGYFKGTTITKSLAYNHIVLRGMGPKYKVGGYVDGDYVPDLSKGFPLKSSGGPVYSATYRIELVEN